MTVQPPGTRPALRPPTPAPMGLPGPASLSQVFLARWVGSTRYSPPTHPPVYPSPYHTQARTPTRARYTEVLVMPRTAVLDTL